MSTSRPLIGTITTSAIGAGAAALVVSMLFAGADRGVSLAVYLAAVGGVVLVQLLRWPGAAWRVDLRPAPSIVTRRPPPDAPDVPAALIELEGLLSEGAYSPRAADHRLRPRLRQLTEDRLLDRQGIHLRDQPRRARDLLGEPSWQLVAPDADAHQPISPGAVEILVARLEEL